MNRLARLVVRLYPSRWRRRYEVELNALIEDAGARPLDLFDLLAGAFKMQFSRWKYPLGLTLAGLVIATLAAELTPKTYVAETSVHLGSKNPADIVRKAMNRPALVEVIRAEGLYESESARLPLEDIVEIFKGNLRIPAATAGGVTTVAFRNADPAVAQRVVLRLAAALAEPGPVNTALNFPIQLTFQMAGAGAGLIAGLAFALLRRRTV